MRNNGGFTHAEYSIRCGDVLDVLRTLPDQSFQGSLSDPPYELGFMGRKWDKAGIAFSVELWREMYRVLEDGSYLLAFGHSRTFHRLTSAIEDAGFEIRDHVLWLYAQGFPKSKACLKPSYEPIVLARKKAQRVLTLNIDGARISPGAPVGGGTPYERWREMEGRKDAPAFHETKLHTRGRWPANIILDEGAAELLDAQSGQVRGGGSVSPKRTNKTNTIYGKYETVTPFEGYKDTGGASRFFYCTKAGKNERKDNRHPCVKPIKLTTWLATLIQHEGRLLVPFSGSGSEMIGGLRAGWSEVVGIERDPKYVKIAERRIAEWCE